MNATRETIINKFVTSSKRHEIFISKRFDASSKNVQLLQKKKKKIVIENYELFVLNTLLVH